MRTFQKLPGRLVALRKRAHIHPKLGPALRQLVDVIVAQPEAAVLSLFRVGKSRLVGVPVSIEARRVDPALEGRPWAAGGAQVTADLQWLFAERINGCGAICSSIRLHMILEVPPRHLLCDQNDYLGGAMPPSQLV